MENISYFITQNFWFCFLCILLLVIYIIFELTQVKKSHTNLSVVDSVTMVNRNKGIYLDTRDSKAFNYNHIVGAQNIDILKFEEKYKKLFKYKSRPIVIYGNQPEKVMLKLRKEGFQQVYILKGGLAEWLESSYPVNSLSR